MSNDREAAMSYLKDFRERIANNDYTSVLKLWEEYCYGDQPDGEELILILQEIKNSEMAKPFGLQVERVLTLWREIKEPKLAHDSLTARSSIWKRPTAKSSPISPRNI